MEARVGAHWAKARFAPGEEWLRPRHGLARQCSI